MTTLESEIAQIATTYHRRCIARRDARAHVRRLLIEALEFGRRLDKAYENGVYHIRVYEDAARASAMDFIEAFSEGIGCDGWSVTTFS